MLTYLKNNRKRSMRWIFLFFFLASCQRPYIAIVQENVNASYLASSQVGTPDPRGVSPPYGRNLIVSWNIPSSLYQKDTELILEVQFKDQKKSCQAEKVDRYKGYRVFYFPEEKGHTILSYKASLKQENGQIIQSWIHQLWTEPTNIDTHCD